MLYRQIGAPKEEAMKERGEYEDNMNYDDTNLYDDDDEMQL